MLDDFDSASFDSRLARVREADSMAVSRLGFGFREECTLPKIGLAVDSLKNGGENHKEHEEEQVGEEALGALLSGLKADVSEFRQREKVLLLKTGSERADICSRLKSVFNYMRELTGTLNALKVPMDGVSYYLLNTGYKLDGLSWREGWADFRSLTEKEGGGVKVVTMAFELSGSGVFTLEREGNESIEKLDQLLFDMGLKFSREDFKNKKGFVERATFRILNEMKAKSAWRADFEKGRILVDMSNIDKIGSRTAVLKPENVGSDLLNEFGMLVLGRRSAFNSFVEQYV